MRIDHATAVRTLTEPKVEQCPRAPPTACAFPYLLPLTGD